MESDVPDEITDFGVAQGVSMLKAADAIAVLTGAGISAESGIPTFRGAGGLWKSHRAEELATPEAFVRDPELVWEFYNYRRRLIAEATPNPAHVALVKLESRVRDFGLITQNVDGLHARAGSKRVWEIHGSIWRVRCTRCGAEFDKSGEWLPERPSCERCGGLLRPGVVWFGEGLPPEVWKEAVEVVRRCDVLLVIGTSSLVQPAASLAGLARREGAEVIEINLESTVASEEASLGIYGRAAAILPNLVQQYLQGGGPCAPTSAQ
jgi:NAD-dependent deacetylase